MYTLNFLRVFTSVTTAFVLIFAQTPLAFATSWEVVGSAGFSAGIAGPGTNRSLAIDSNDTLYLVYRDGANSNKATVMTYNGSSWETVGSAGFSADTAYYNSLAIDSNDTLYVAYRDGGNSNKATVMTYNGSSWEAVGSAGFSAGTASQISFAIDSSNTPYVAYSDGNNTNKTTVMTYNGSSWETVGSAGFSAGPANYNSLAIDSNDTLYVAYRDGGNSNKATVMTYNGSSWETVGSAGFSALTVSYPSLAFDSSDTPYVAYVDYSKATVMTYNGSSWEVVGSTAFSAGSIGYISLAMNSADIPYVAYSDYANSYKATVMTYNGSSWETVGSAGFSAGNIYDTSLAIDSNDTPYVAYRDEENGDKATVMKYAAASESNIATGGRSFSIKTPPAPTLSYSKGMLTIRYNPQYTTTDELGYTLTADDGEEDTAVVDTNTHGTFYTTHVLTDLACDTTYTVTAYAKNTKDTTYSDEVSFTTADCDEDKNTEDSTEDITSICTPYLTTYITPQGNNDTESVKKLETFLNEKQGESLSIDGVYGEDDIAAVKRFQAKYASEVLEIWGLSEPTGYVYRTTLMKINSFYCDQSIACPYFTEYNDLNENPNSKEVLRTKILLSELGFYDGAFTTIFDSTLKSSLITFQETFRATMLDPWGLAYGTGYKYKTTNKFLNSLVGCETDSVNLEGIGVFDY